MEDEIVNTNNLENVINIQKKVKKKSNLFLFLLIILDLIAVFCLIMAYGPNKTFKNFLVTTAMATMNHKYLARTIYSEKMINKVLEENCIIELNENTNTDSITIGNYQTSSYESKYEEQILKKDKNEKNFIFNTSNLTIVMAGAFVELAKRPRNDTGFNSTLNKNKLEYSDINTDKLSRYGFPHEALRRINIISLNELTIENLLSIIKDSKYSVVTSYKTK